MLRPISRTDPVFEMKEKTKTKIRRKKVKEKEEKERRERERDKQKSAITANHLTDERILHFRETILSITLHFCEHILVIWLVFMANYKQKSLLEEQ